MKGLRKQLTVRDIKVALIKGRLTTVVWNTTLTEKEVTLLKVDLPKRLEESAHETVENIRGICRCSLEQIIFYYGFQGSVLRHSQSRPLFYSRQDAFYEGSESSF